MKTSKFKKGEDVIYAGQQAKVRSVKFNVFSEEFIYTLYWYQPYRYSVSGVSEVLIKKM